MLTFPKHTAVGQNNIISTGNQKYGTTLSGHLRLPKGNPIGGAYVIVMDEEEKEVLGYVQTKSGRGPEAGSWMINGIPPNQDVVIKAIHESLPRNIAILTHKTSNDYIDKVCCLTMDTTLPNPIPFDVAGGALGIIGLMGSIAREINTANQMKKTEQFISDFNRTKNEDQLIDQLFDRINDKQQTYQANIANVHEPDLHTLRANYSDGYEELMDFIESTLKKQIKKHVKKELKKSIMKQNKNTTKYNSKKTTTAPPIQKSNKNYPNYKTQRPKNSSSKFPWKEITDDARKSSSPKKGRYLGPGITVVE